ncbi:response regulator [Patescibacteria group bacterium]|nr:response regulator [Patescibacteria group bacterium]MBU1705302.1 response regulator [Patescibacteria group bacterium]
MPTKKPSKKPHILVVEDEPALREMYAAWLEAEKYQVSTAEDGVVGIDHIMHQQPDLVLLDIMLPKKDGFEVLAEVRRNPKTRDLPVIILSSLDKDYEQKQGINLGAEHYLVKTDISPELLYQTINQVLKQ